MKKSKQLKEELEEVISRHLGEASQSENEIIYTKLSVDKKGNIIFSVDWDKSADVGKIKDGLIALLSFFSHRKDLYSSIINAIQLAGTKKNQLDLVQLVLSFWVSIIENEEGNEVCVSAGQVFANDHKDLGGGNIGGNDGTIIE